MSKEVTYKCDLCLDICTIDILEGIKIGKNGIERSNFPETSDKHICHRCIEYIEDTAFIHNKEEENKQ